MKEKREKFFDNSNNFLCQIVKDDGSIYRF